MVCVSRFRRKKAFTLLEVMVVMTIVGVTLVAVILPGLARSAQIARSVGCSKNLADICRALESYHAAYAGFPYNYCDDNHAQGAPDDGLGRWALAYLSPYLGGPAGVTIHGKWYPNKLERIAAAQLPRAYICPNASPEVFLGANVTTAYHASYFTNPAVRVNMGWDNWLVTPYGNTDIRPLIYDTGGTPTGRGSGGLARLYGKSCPDATGWRSVYHPTIDSMPVTSQIVFAGDTNNKQNTGLMPNPSYVAPPGDWEIQPGVGPSAPVAGSIGFDRHLGKVMLGYCDGHASPFDKAALSNWGGWYDTNPIVNGSTGDFMVKYPPGPWGCTSAGRVRGLHLLGPTIVSGIK